MEKEKIIEILKMNIGTYQLCDDGDPINITGFEKSADEILAELSEVRESTKEDFPDIDFRRDIAEELSRDELIDRLCEMNESYQKIRKEWFDKCVLNKESVQTVTDEEISTKLDSMNFETSKEREDAYDLCDWLRSRLQPVLTDEQIEKK